MHSIAWMHSLTWNVRVKELSRMSKAELVAIWRAGAGQCTVWSFAPPERWMKDELVADILSHEFPNGGLVETAVAVQS